jgi:hypothetical protein
LRKYYYGDHIKEGEIGNDYSSHGKTVKCVNNFGCKTLREVTNWEIGGGWEYDIKMNLKELRYEVVDCI